MKNPFQENYIRPSRPDEPTAEDIDAFAYQIWADNSRNEKNHTILWLEVQKQLLAA